jgi:hypothetical protein
MKIIANTLIAMLLVAAPALGAGDKTDSDDGIKLFAVASLSTDKELMEDDSVLVTLTLYSNLSFSRVENLDKDKPEVKDAKVRTFGNSRRLTQNVSAYEGKRYYSVVAEQFVVAVHKEGNLTFPSRKYNVTLAQTTRSQRFYSPFDDFFGFEVPYGERTTKAVKKKCESESIKIKVVKRPPKTMHDIERGGAVLM